jgi:hypothetical protein
MTNVNVKEKLRKSVDNFNIDEILIKDQNQHRNLGTDSEHIEALRESFRLAGIPPAIAQIEIDPETGKPSVVNGVHSYFAYRENHKVDPEGFPKEALFEIVGPFKNDTERKVFQFQQNVFRPQKAVNVDDTIAHIKLLYAEGLKNKTFIETESEGSLRSQLRPLIEKEVPFFSQKRKDKVLKQAVSDLSKKDTSSSKMNTYPLLEDQAEIYSQCTNSGWSGKESGVLDAGEVVYFCSTPSFITSDVSRVLYKKVNNPGAKATIICASAERLPERLDNWRNSMLREYDRVNAIPSQLYGKKEKIFDKIFFLTQKGDGQEVENSLLTESQVRAQLAVKNAKVVKIRPPKTKS